MPNNAYNTYKLKKNETLEQVARSHKLRLDEVWKFAPNSKLVAKRHTPDKCEPGDVVELPVSAAEKQAALAGVEKMLGALGKRLADIAAAEKRLELILGGVDAKHKALVAELDKAAQAVQRDGDLADAANTVIGFGVSMVQLSRAALECGATKLVGTAAEIDKQCVDMSKGLLKSTTENLVGPLSPGGGAFAALLAQGKDSTRAFVGAVGTAADFFGRITSPSGWAKFLTGVDGELARAREQIDEQYVDMHRYIRLRREALQKEAKAVGTIQTSLGRAYLNMKKG